MAVVSGTKLKYDMQGIRERLSDVISNISPEETPILSSFGSGPEVDNTLFEWQQHELGAADGDNAHLEGDETSYTTPTQPVRLGNYTQISKKSGRESGTSEAMNTAGRKSDKAMQIAMRGAELKIDQETIVCRAQGANAGAAGTARRIAGLNAFVKTNVDMAGDGGNPTYTSGVPGAARTDGTQRPFTETIHKAVLQACWTTGAKVKTVFLGPVNKVKFSSFSGVVTRNYDQSNVDPSPTAVIAAADVYVSDFGTVRVLPSRNQRERDGWYLDFEMLKRRNLKGRAMIQKDLAITGDATPWHLLSEWSVEIRNEGGLGLAADLTTA